MSGIYQDEIFESLPMLVEFKNWFIQDAINCFYV